MGGKKYSKPTEPDADTLTDFKTMLLRRDGGWGRFVGIKEAINKALQSKTCGYMVHSTS